MRKAVMVAIFLHENNPGPSSSTGSEINVWQYLTKEGNTD